MKLGIWLFGPEFVALQLDVAGNNQPSAWMAGGMSAGPGCGKTLVAGRTWWIGAGEKIAQPPDEDAGLHVVLRGFDFGGAVSPRAFALAKPVTHNEYETVCRFCFQG